jgi:hypothetical protein
LAAAKAMARRQHRTLGEMISILVRQALRPAVTGGPVRNGVPLLPRQSGALPVTPELVNQLRDELS